MIFGNGLKNKPLNNTRLVLYPMRLVERIIGMFCPVLLIIPIVALIYNHEDKFEAIIVLVALLIACFIMYLIVFKTYICLDITKNKLIISERLKKEELSLENVISIEVSDGTDIKDLLTIYINKPGYTKKIKLWFFHRYSGIFIAGYKTQTKRLKIFCEECNKYLESRNNQQKEK